MNAIFARSLVEKTRRDYDAIAASFVETRRTAQGMESFVRGVRSGDRVADIGCGNGRLLDVLPIGVNYTGCDVSSRMIAIAEERQTVQLPTVRFVIGDVLSLPFPAASFDHVFALAVLHHIPSVELRQQAMRELARVMRPGGRITLSVWNLWHPLWIIRYHLWRLFFGMHPKGYDRGDCLISWKRGVAKNVQRYVHAFTAREIRALCRASGLSVLEQRFFARKGQAITVATKND